MEADKTNLRREMRARAAALSDEEALRLSEDIWRQTELLPSFIEARNILIYMSIPGEVPTPSFIGKWASRKRFVLPLVCGDHLELKTYDPERLVAGYRGILEPSQDAQSVKPAEIDLALIPGMAFCRRGDKVGRLGRGGGFYDRLLPQLSCPKIGIAFSFREVDEIPCDPWDAGLDGLIVNAETAKR